MTTERPDVSPDDMVGNWRLSFDYGPEKIIDLLPGGRIANEQDARWKLDDSQLSLNWPDEPAGGTIPPRCFIDPNKDSFIGRDRNGVVIRGKKLCR
jgi:hypothetical protein